MNRHPGTLDEDTRLRLKALLSRSEALEEAYELVKAFATMMNEREGHQIGGGIEAAIASGLPGLRRFARGLTFDLDAVTVGLTLEYSSGAAEGNVNHCKMIKRKLYGRANLGLLRKLVILSR